jgi:hypothetical protein
MTIRSRTPRELGKILDELMQFDKFSEKCSMLRSVRDGRPQLQR